MKVDRLVSILLDKERIGAQELADMFEVSPRTIYRDIDSINMAGIPVCSVPGVGGGFEIMQKYKIDRKVFSTVIQEEYFTPRDYQKPQLDFTDILATMQTKTKIRIHKSVMDRVLDYCAYEHFSPDGDEHYIVSIPFIENDYYYNILLSFGDKCECLEPLHIRTEMKRRIHDIATLYEN